MAQNQRFIDNFRPGQIYDAHGEVVIIVDILRSEFTAKIMLCVRFIRNVGNSRQYDILELTPEKHLGVIDWRLTSIAELRDSVNRRADWLQDELDQLLTFALERN